MINKTIIFILSLFMLPVQVYAATIHGTVYDLSLEPIDAFVEINSVPKQFVVATNGEYSFSVNPGKYVLRANTSEGYDIEPIEIVEEGDYTIDIIIGLDIDEPTDFIDDAQVIDVGIGLNDSNSSNFNLTIFGILIIMIIAIFALIMFISKNNYELVSKRAKMRNEATDLEGISDIEIRAVSLIREHSRITQKELRKMLPYSEAKVSLVIAQLESEGKIKKIKKGRGNILVYVKG